MTATTIFSERLDLVPLSPAFLKASLAGDRSAVEHLIGLSIPPDWLSEQSLMRLRLEQLEKDPRLQQWLLRAIGSREQRSLVGDIGFHAAPGAEYLREIAPGSVEYGFTVYPSFRRHGYAREACEALMTWAAREHGVGRFVVTIRPDNVPSRRLAQTLGFRRIGSHIDDDDGPEDIFELHCQEAVRS